jgi:hypothetical protein
MVYVQQSLADSSNTAACAAGTAAVSEMLWRSSPIFTYSVAAYRIDLRKSTSPNPISTADDLPPGETTFKIFFVLRDFDTQSNSRSNSLQTSQDHLDNNERIKSPSKLISKATEYGVYKNRSNVLATRFFGRTEPVRHGPLRKGEGVCATPLSGNLGEDFLRRPCLDMDCTRNKGCQVLSTWLSRVFHMAELAVSPYA